MYRVPPLCAPEAMREAGWFILRLHGIDLAGRVQAASPGVVPGGVGGLDPALSCLLMSVPGMGRMVSASGDLLGVLAGDLDLAGLGCLVHRDGQGEHSGGVVGADMAVNLRGPFLLVQAAAKVLAQSAHGRVVLTASTAAFGGGAGTAAYAASKGGLVAMTRSLALGLAHARICVNCVAPGWIDTPFNQPYWNRVGDSDESHAALEARIPLGVQGATPDVAAAIVFLASPAARYISGQALIVDGGLLAS